MLPSFVSLAIAIDTRKNATIDMKREREEEQPPAPLSIPSVQPEEVIETFIHEYNKAYEEVRKANLATSPRSVFEENDVVRAQLAKDLQTAIDAKLDAKRVLEEIRAKGRYYTSEVGKAARKADPSLKMSDAQKREELGRLKEAHESISKQETHIPKIQKVIDERNNRLYWLYELLNLMRQDYSASLWNNMKQAFNDAIGLWTDSKGGNFSFMLRVAPWDNRSFRLNGLVWLQDLVFQRKLLSMLPNPKIVITTGGPRITFGSGNKTFESGVAALEIAIAINVAAIRIHELYDGRRVARKPDGVTVQNLIGWDIPLGMGDIKDEGDYYGLLQSFHSLQEFTRRDTVDSHTAEFVWELINQVIDQGLYTRKLAILVNTGDTGARARVAKHSCVEFGLGGQTCSTVTTILGMINKSSSMFGSTLFAKSIDVKNNKDKDVKAFKRNDARVALIIWGGHARVIFKVGEGCAIVDPWKSAEKVRPPAAIRDAFGSEPEWIEREPEQCGEGSCSIIAMARAVILSIVAGNGDDADALRAAAKSDLLDKNVHGPIAVMLVRCAHMIATPSAYPQKEVF